MKQFNATIAILCALTISGSALAQFSITPSDDTTVLKNALMGSVPDTRITITDIQFQGAPTAAGTYLNGPLGIDDGIVLASGDVFNALPPDDDGAKGTSFDLSGCDECNSLIPGYTSYDAAILTLTFDVGAIDGVRFDFVFGSEEYPEYVGSSFNDVFGAFLNTTQIAFDQDGNPITINGPWFSGSSVIVPPANGMQYDGSTTLLTAVGGVVPNSQGNTLRFFICDAGDTILDSGILIAHLRGCVGGDCSGPVRPPTVQLTPAFEKNPVNTSHTLTAKVTDEDSTPIAGVSVTFTVTAGPNAGLLGSDTTDANGEATFSYIGTAPGLDTIEASIVINGIVYVSESVQKEWESTCTAPVAICTPSTKVSNSSRYYRALTGTSDCYPCSALTFYVGDTATPAFVAGPFACEDVVRVSKATVATVKPGKYGTAAIITVRGSATVWAVDPDGRVGAVVVCP